jgi:hypothetical protein
MLQEKGEKKQFLKKGDEKNKEPQQPAHLFIFGNSVQSSSTEAVHRSPSVLVFFVLYGSSSVPRPVAVLAM